MTVCDLYRVIDNYRTIIEDRNYCLYIGCIYDVPGELLYKIIDGISIFWSGDIVLHILVE